MKAPHRIIRSVLTSLLALFFFVGCNSSTVDDLVDIAEGVPRRPIDTGRMGVNAFANQGFAGSICGQYAEIRDTLRLKFVRVLFNWDDNVQPSPGAEPNFSFYDAILKCIPAGVDALVILTNVPSWMSNSGNWVNENPRETVARNWVRKVARRYAGNKKIVGYQIWNEPNNRDFAENETLQVLESPDNFVELVALSSGLIKDIDSSKLVLNGATTSIAQNYPGTLDYNRGMRDAGVEQFVDRYAIHYYGTNFENLVRDVDGFLNSLTPPIWVTESGKQGVTTQLPYVEQTWPFLREHIPSIDRIYYFRYAEATPGDISYGLRSSDPAFPVSDLYLFLRDRE